MINRIKGSDIASWSGGVLLGDDWTFDGLFQVDSRKVSRGDVFVALRGASSDGHDHVFEAVERGASGVLVRSDWAKGRNLDRRHSFVVLDDVQVGLISMAKKRLSNVEWALGITGSVGKTTVREMIYRAFDPDEIRVHRARNSHNTLIGCALTLAEMPLDSTGVILEMGTNHPGEIAQMVEAFPIDVALITKVSPAHLEGLGDIDGVIRAKTEILGSVSLKKAIVGGEDPSLVERVCSIASYNEWPVISVGAGSSDYDILDRGFSWVDAPKVYADLAFSGGEVRLEARLLGEHNAFLMSLAFAVCVELGGAPQKIAKRIASFSAFKGRGELSEMDGFTVIDESYNANPDSMMAALSAVGCAPVPKERVFLVLGEMKELGDSSERYHRVILEKAKDVGRVFLYGESWKSVADEPMIWINLRDLAIRLKDEVSPGDVVLVKGSRSNGLEKIWSLM
ncbi:MAG: UDP-N-acetylmuramoyl-tripeptide--D-alanyl-D-alanine ligase [Synergistales bacterium]|nr:UDP-N-acetylmuramoyl-tripeptide--D-alanyl-D-alanine ligase [Synergistales bacterium]